VIPEELATISEDGYMIPLSGKSKKVSHTCCFIQDHMNLDSTQITSIVANSVKANPSILVKSLIVKIQNHYGYFVIQ